MRRMVVKKVIRYTVVKVPSLGPLVISTTLFVSFAASTEISRNLWSFRNLAARCESLEGPALLDKVLIEFFKRILLVRDSILPARREACKRRDRPRYLN